MHRLVLVAGGTATLLSLAACGGSSAASSGTSSSTGGSQPAAGAPGTNGTRVPRGAAGQLAQINGTSLVLNTQAGDVTVTYGPSTTITQTRTGTLADITKGSCVVATGQKDASGTLTATSVRLSQPVNGACSTGLGTRPGNASGTPRRTLPPGQPAPSFAAGTVTAVSGTAITLQPASGAAQTITVPTTVTISEASPVSASSLSVGECVSAQGPRSSSGTVTAQSLSIVPPGPSGCFTGRRGFGGFGGFGGGTGSGGGTGAGAGGTTGG